MTLRGAFVIAILVELTLRLLGWYLGINALKAPAVGLLFFVTAIQWWIFTRFFWVLPH